METSPRKTVVAVFGDRINLNRAVEALKGAGFQNDEIGVITPHAESERHEHGPGMSTEETFAEEGALAGVLTGAGLGALAGLGVLSGMIPAVGPAIVAGTMGCLLSNAALGAGMAGVTGALIGAGIPEEDAHHYAGQVRARRSLVTVSAGQRADEVAALLRDCGGLLGREEPADTAVPEAAPIAQTPATSAPAAPENDEEQLITLDGGITLHVDERDIGVGRPVEDVGEAKPRHTDTGTRMP